MGPVIGIFVALFLIGGLISLLRDGASSKEWRPFFGIFLIAGMIAVLGIVVGFVFPDAVEVFMEIAKWVAVIGAFALCLKIIGNILKAFFPH